jgi:hypothetical protein
VPSPSGFWSYVHSDDDAEGGRISRLARDVVARYEMITGESIELFLDRDDVNWGDAWRSRIDGSLAEVAFFIPVITPRYFQSAECRRELTAFATKARSLGVQELLLPILYVDVPELHTDQPSDEAMKLVKSFQWEDWRELSFAEPDSSDYRRGVARLADRLLRANQAAEAADVAQAVILGAQDEDEGDDEEPGLIDRLAAGEAALPEWSETLEAISVEMGRVTEITQSASEDMDRRNSQGKGFAGRLAVARHLARDLRDPAERIEELGQDFTRQLHDVDEGIRAMIQVAPEEARQGPQERQQVCDFFNSIREMARGAEDGLGAMENLVVTIGPVEAMSRDLRPPLRTLRAGLTVMAEGRSVIREWVRLIDEADVDCA